MQRFLKDKSSILNILFYILISVIILGGIYIRIRYYIFQSPLWLDEIMLASSFTDRSLLDVFSPLDAYQKAPPMFSFLVLFIRKIFGINELSLRFVPCLLGISSVVAFLLLLKENVKNKFGIFTGLCMFAFCVPLVYFCGEFKPYGCDVFFCILLLLLYKYIDISRMSLKQTVIYSVCTVFFVFVSIPTVFIIPAIVISKFLENKSIDKKVSIIFLAFLIAGLMLFIPDIQNYLFLKEYWGHVEKGFTIFSSLDSLFLLIKDACIYYIYNFNVHYCIYICAFLLAGFLMLFRDKKNKAILISLIFIFAVIASVLNVYPLKPKLVLFMLPIFILLLAKSFDITNFIVNKTYSILSGLLFIVCFVYFIGINIPYVNIPDNQIAFYNRTSKGRDKSLSERNSVKESCIFLIDNSDSNNRVLASAEFLYSLRYYKAYLKSQKNINIETYADIAQKRLSDKDIEIIVTKFLDENLNSGNDIWFMGRDNEYYFQCPNYSELEKILNRYNLKYKSDRYRDLYLIHVL